MDSTIPPPFPNCTLIMLSIMSLESYEVQSDKLLSDNLGFIIILLPVLFFETSN